MPLAVANALKLPIVIITQWKIFQFCPSHQEKQLNACQYLLHLINLVQTIYDAVEMSSTQSMPPLKEIDKTDTELGKDDSCRCGQGAKKGEKDTISCEVFKKKMQVLLRSERLLRQVHVSWLWKPIWEEY